MNPGTLEFVFIRGGWYYTSYSLHSHMMYLIQSLLIYSSIFHISQSRQVIYDYLRNLCPDDLIPLTNSTSVHTCDDICPYSSKCINGICCSSPPKCTHDQYSYSTTFPCLPITKQNCPKGTKCLPSTNNGQFICCGNTINESRRGSKIRSGKNKNEIKESSKVEDICPIDHPIVLSHPQRGFMLCNQCKKGVCVQFRRSDVLICCQSDSMICGDQSIVERKGAVAVDCSIDQCSSGYQCKSSPNGQNVCCSIAVCSDGSKPMRSCAGGCLDGEKCESINGDRWCCGKEEESVGDSIEYCPDGSTTKTSCTIGSSSCPRGQKCIEIREDEVYRCCPTKLKNKGLIRGTKPKKDISKCMDGSIPLSKGNELIECIDEGSSCSKNGYSCQYTTTSSLHCCPIQQIESIDTTTIHSSIVVDKCPFSYQSITSILNGKIRTCTGFLDFTCPFGYTCMPSSTSTSFICCIKSL